MNHTELQHRVNQTSKPKKTNSRADILQLQSKTYNIDSIIIHTLRLENVRYFNYLKILIKNVHF